MAAVFVLVEMIGWSIPRHRHYSIVGSRFRWLTYAIGERISEPLMPRAFVFRDHDSFRFIDWNSPEGQRIWKAELEADTFGAELAAFPWPSTRGLFGPVITAWSPSLDFYFTGDLSPAEQVRARAAFADWTEHTWSGTNTRPDPEFFAAARSGTLIERWSAGWLAHDALVVGVAVGLIVSLGVHTAGRKRRCTGASPDTTETLA